MIKRHVISAQKTAPNAQPRTNAVNVVRVITSKMIGVLDMCIVQTRAIGWLMWRKLRSVRRKQLCKEGLNFIMMGNMEPPVTTIHQEPQPQSSADLSNSHIKMHN